MASTPPDSVSADDALRRSVHPFFESLQAAGVRVDFRSDGRDGDPVDFFEDSGKAFHSSAELAKAAETAAKALADAQLQSLDGLPDGAEPTDLLMAAPRILENLLSCLFRAAGPASAADACARICSSSLPFDPYALQAGFLAELFGAGLSNSELLAACSGSADVLSAIPDPPPAKAARDAFFLERVGFPSGALPDAEALRLAASRPESEESLLRLFQPFSPLNAASINDGGPFGASPDRQERMGRRAAEALSGDGLRGPFPKRLFKLAGLPFDLGFICALPHSSKTASAAFDDVCERLRGVLDSIDDYPPEPVAVGLRCAVSAFWFSLDRARIDAFDARFPELSDLHLAEGARQRWTHDFASRSALRVALRSSGSQWIRPFFGEQPFANRPDGPDPASIVSDAFTAALASRRALDIAASASPPAGHSARKPKSI